MISASRRVEAPSRHRRDSRPSDEVVDGFLFDFEAVRTDLTPRRRPSAEAAAAEGSCVSHGVHWFEWMARTEIT